MKRLHVLVLALLLGAAAVAATFAVLTTASLGTGAKAAPAVSSAEIAARNAKLDKAEAAMRRALKKKPPALPKLPKRVDSQPRLVRVTPPAAPVAAPTTQSGSDDDHEAEWEGEEDDD